MSQDRVDYFFSRAMLWIGIAGTVLMVGLCAWAVLTIPIKLLQWGLGLFAIPCGLYFLWIGCTYLRRIHEPALTLFQDRINVRLFRPLEVRFSEIASAEISAYAGSGVPHLVLQLKGPRAGETIAINLSPIKGDDLGLLAEVKSRIAAAQ